MTTDSGAEATSDLWEPFGEPVAGYCCIDNYASVRKGGPPHHTGGCPNRCGQWVSSQRPDGPAAYPCSYTANHVGDCWLHPAYRAAAVR